MSSGPSLTGPPACSGSVPAIPTSLSIADTCRGRWCWKRPGARSYGRTTLTQGQSAFVALSWGGSNVPASQDEAFSALNITVDFWRNWLSSAKIPDHPWKPYLDRSALTLKALSYAPTGAIMAASTTSLPETPGGAAARGADLAAERGDDERAKRWRAGAEEIRAEVLDKGVSSKGVFRQHYETDDLDASLLLLPIMGFLPSEDERIRATVLAIADDLTEDGLVLRYRVEGTDTGFEGNEGTFTICSFWLVTKAM